MIAQDHGTGWDDRDVTDAKLSALAHVIAKRTKQWMGECANTITADTCTVSRDYTCSAKTTDVFACQTDVTTALAGKKITNVDVANKKVTYVSDGSGATQITADQTLAGADSVTYTGPDGDNAYTYSTEPFVESILTAAI